MKRRVLAIVLGLTVLVALIDLALGLLCAPRDRLESILEIFELHPTRLWALRPDLDTTFQGAPLRTDSRGARVVPGQPGGGSIACLGDSLTFGWGVGDGEAWPARLQERIGRPVRNLAVPGYTSWQGLRVLEEEALPSRPEVVLVSYGVNDVSRGRFFRSDLRPDAAQESRSPALTTLANLGMGTGTYRFLRHRALLHRASDLELQAAGLRKLDEAPPRVSLEEYSANLSALAARSRDAGSRVAFVLLPLNLPLPPKVPRPRAEAALVLFARARQGDPATALRLLWSGLEEDPRARPETWKAYDLARAAGDREGMTRALTLLKKQEVWAASGRHVDSNRAMRAVAAASGTSLVDIEREFARAGGSLFNDPRLDPYHPNPRGHRLIAEAVASSLR